MEPEEEKLNAEFSRAPSNTDKEIFRLLRKLDTASSDSNLVAEELFGRFVRDSKDEAQLTPDLQELCIIQLANYLKFEVCMMNELRDIGNKIPNFILTRKVDLEDMGEEEFVRKEFAKHGNSREAVIKIFYVVVNYLETDDERFKRTVLPDLSQPATADLSQPVTSEADTQDPLEVAIDEAKEEKVPEATKEETVEEIKADPPLPEVPHPEKKTAAEEVQQDPPSLKPQEEVPKPEKKTETPSPPAQEDTYTLQQLQDKEECKRLGIDPKAKEKYLSDEDFVTHFGMSREEFLKMPGFKKEMKKKSLKIY